MNTNYYDYSNGAIESDPIHGNGGDNGGSSGGRWTQAEHELFLQGTC